MLLTHQIYYISLILLIKQGIFNILIDSFSLNIRFIITVTLVINNRKNKCFIRNIQYFGVYKFSILIRLKIIDFFHLHFLKSIHKKILNFELLKIFQYYLIIHFISIRRKYIRII